LDKSQIDDLVKLNKLGIINDSDFIEVTQGTHHVLDQVRVPETGPRFRFLADAHSFKPSEHDLALYRDWTGENGERIVEMSGSFEESSFSVEVRLSNGTVAYLSLEQVSTWYHQISGRCEVDVKGKAAVSLSDDEIREIDATPRMDWSDLVVLMLDKLAPAATKLAVDRTLAARFNTKG
jgi:hypothetical protein